MGGVRENGTAKKTEQLPSPRTEERYKNAALETEFFWPLVQNSFSKKVVVFEFASQSEFDGTRLKPLTWRKEVSEFVVVFHHHHMGIDRR